MSRTAVGQPAETAGFTLIEIMIALAILGTALFVLLQAQGGALRLQLLADDQLTETYLSLRAINQAEIEALAGNVSGSGDFGARFEGYSYTFSATASNADQPKFYTLEVSVTTPYDTRVTQTLLYDPRR